MSAKKEESSVILLPPVCKTPQPKDVESAADLLERARRAEEASQELIRRLRSGMQESKEIFATCQRWWREMQALYDEEKPEP